MPSINDSPDGMRATTAFEESAQLKVLERDVTQDRASPLFNQAFGVQHQPRIVGVVYSQEAIFSASFVTSGLAVEPESRAHPVCRISHGISRLYRRLDTRFVGT